MELFRDDGCLTDEGLHALIENRLDELGRLETAEHLSYCDRCMDRYTALLTEDVLETPPHSMKQTVMTTIWVRMMQNTYGRIAVAAVAAVMAFGMWRSGVLRTIPKYTTELQTILPPAQTVDLLPEQQPAQPQGKPMETRRERYEKLTGALKRLLPGGVSQNAPSQTTNS